MSNCYNGYMVNNNNDHAPTEVCAEEVRDVGGGGAGRLLPQQQHRLHTVHQIRACRLQGGYNNITSLPPTTA